MGIDEQEALAQQLNAIWAESFGNDNPNKTWYDLSDRQRTAWRMVAQFVEAQSINKVNAILNLLQDIEPDHK